MGQHYSKPTTPASNSSTHGHRHTRKRAQGSPLPRTLQDENPRSSKRRHRPTATPETDGTQLLRGSASKGLARNPKTSAAMHNSTSKRRRHRRHHTHREKPSAFLEPHLPMHSNRLSRDEIWDKVNRWKNTASMQTPPSTSSRTSLAEPDYLMSSPFLKNDLVTPPSSLSETASFTNPEDLDLTSDCSKEQLSTNELSPLLNLKNADTIQGLVSAIEDCDRIGAILNTGKTRDTLRDLDPLRVSDLNTIFKHLEQYIRSLQSIIPQNKLALASNLSYCRVECAIVRADTSLALSSFNKHNNRPVGPTLRSPQLTSVKTLAKHMRSMLEEIRDHLYIIVPEIKSAAPNTEGVHSFSEVAGPRTVVGSLSPAFLAPPSYVQDLGTLKKELPTMAPYQELIEVASSTVFYDEESYIGLQTGLFDFYEFVVLGTNFSNKATTRVCWTSAVRKEDSPGHLGSDRRAQIRRHVADRLGSNPRSFQLWFGSDPGCQGEGTDRAKYIYGHYGEIVKIVLDPYILLSIKDHGMRVIDLSKVFYNKCTLRIGMLKDMISERLDLPREAVRILVWLHDQKLTDDFITLQDTQLLTVEQLEGRQPVELRVEIENLTKECSLCTEDQEYSHFPSRITKQCNHEATTCKSCISNWIKAKLDENNFQNIACLECPATMEFDDIQRCARRREFNRYDKLLNLAFLSADPDFRWCVSPKCNSGQIHHEGLVSMFVCHTCNLRHCTTHLVPWHDGETCAEYDYRKSGAKKRDEEKASEKKIKETTKKCPKCKSPIEKSSGCNHMTCRKCKYEFCWVCLADYGKGCQHFPRAQPMLVI